jgi:hypothetical protein
MVILQYQSYSISPKFIGNNANKIMTMIISYRQVGSPNIRMIQEDETSI